jgi:hypothetical protein
MSSKVLAEPAQETTAKAGVEIAGSREVAIATIFSTVTGIPGARFTENSCPISSAPVSHE